MAHRKLFDYLSMLFLIREEDSVDADDVECCGEGLVCLRNAK